MSNISQVISKHHDQIIKYDAMCHAIQECHKVDEVKSIRDKAMALEVYAAQAMNTDAERKACEIRLRAERRAGELLKDMKATGQRASAQDNLKKGQNPKSNDTTSENRTLSYLGITRDQSSKWQALAEVPQDEFEDALRDPVKPSTAGILAKRKDAPKMDKDALWLWGRLRDFESDRICERDQLELLNAMTATMQADVFRIAPIVAQWLKTLTRD